MSCIKYYQLKEDEELPDEFCAVKDINGEPSEYTFYRPEAENAKLRDDLEDQEGYDQMLRDRLRQQTELHVKAEAENAKLRKLVRDAIYARDDADWASIVSTAIALGVEVDG